MTLKAQPSRKQRGKGGATAAVNVMPQEGDSHREAVAPPSFRAVCESGWVSKTGAKIESGKDGLAP